jgi:hypothetical protein
MLQRQQARKPAATFFVERAHDSIDGLMVPGDLTVRMTCTTGTLTLMQQTTLSRHAQSLSEIGTYLLPIRLDPELTSKRTSYSLTAP